MAAHSTFVAVAEPNRRMVARAPRPKPVTCHRHARPAEAAPVLGLTAVIVGGPNLKESPPDPEELVPFGVVTVTCVVSAVEPGERAVSEVGDSLAKLLASVNPNFTPITPLNPVPLTVTPVPPPAGPTPGVTLVTLGLGPFGT